MKLFSTLVSILALPCLVSQGLAQQPAATMSSIRVTGDAVVTAKPDRVQIDVGVVTQSPQSQTAAAQNAQRLQAVLTALRKAVGPDTDIKTVSYSLSPNYQYHANGGEPTITGYTATNVIRVTLDELARIGNVIDTATQSGANHVQEIQFTLRDQESVKSQALREAAAKARSEADTLAAALGLKVTRIVTVEESSPVTVPVRPVMFARAEAAASTPVQAGTLDVEASVSLTVEVVPGAR